jgi:hypothetical protein
VFSRKRAAPLTTQASVTPSAAHAGPLAVGAKATFEERIRDTPVESEAYAAQRENAAASEAARTMEAASQVVRTDEGQAFRDEKAKLFISYSHRDERHRKLLEIHLASLLREGVIVIWHDLKITPGEHWQLAIGNWLNSADCVLLLVTPDFLASDYCYSIEMQQALEKHREGRILVIPVIVRPADWEHTPLRELQALPAGAKPVVEWKNRDRAWLNVAVGLRRALVQVRSS